MQKTTISKSEEIELKLKAQNVKINSLKKEYSKLEEKTDKLRKDFKAIYKFILACLIVQTILLLMLLVFSMNLA